MDMGVSKIGTGTGTWDGDIKGKTGTGTGTKGKHTEQDVWGHQGVKPGRGRDRRILSKADARSLA